MALVFPAGALAEETDITIRVNAASPAGVIGRAYDLEPEGITFGQPVTLRRTFESSDLGSLIQADDLWIVTLEGGEWMPVFSGIELDGEGGGTVSVELAHFSVYALRGPVVPTGPPNDVLLGSLLSGCLEEQQSPNSELVMSSGFTSPLVPCAGDCNIAPAPAAGQGVALDPGRVDVWGGTMQRVDIVIANRGGEVRVLARTWDRELYRVIPASTTGVQTLHILGGSAPIYMLEIDACSADLHEIRVWGNIQD